MGEGRRKCVQTQKKKREAEEADKVEVAPGVTVASLRRLRSPLIGPTQGLPKRRRTVPLEKTETLRVRSVVDAIRLGVWLRSGEGIGWLAAGTIPNSLYRVPFYLFLGCVFYSIVLFFLSFLFCFCCVFLFSLELCRCVKNDKRSACKHKAATVLPNRAAAT